MQVMAAQLSDGALLPPLCVCLTAFAWLWLCGSRLCLFQSGLKDGYAPFCKHLFIPASHFGLQVPCAYAEITDANKAQLESLYSARTDKELPVLTRFFAQSDAQRQGWRDDEA